MGFFNTRTFCRASLIGVMASFLGAGAGAAASGDTADSQEAGTASESDKAVVVPYKTRQAPSHRVSLRDDRVFFLKRLEETDGGFVLHTMENETIEVEQSEVAEIVEFRNE